MLSFLHTLQLLVISVVFVSGCFITNCPPGGKRSDAQEKTHQCGQCGPHGLGGRCYGPQICCSPLFGCLIGGPVTSVCQQETHSPSLCHNKASSCDGNGDTGPINGQCAASGICCTPESCTIDEDCIGTQSEIENGHPMKHGPLLLHFSEEPENTVSLAHGPADAWFYRRLIHNKPKVFSGGSSGKSLSHSEADALSSTIPQGPPFVPIGPPRVVDYF